MRKYFITIAILALGFTACNKEIESPQKTPEQNPDVLSSVPVYYFNLPASFGGDASTKAVTIGEKSAQTTFAETDKVYVVIEHDGVYGIAYDPGAGKCVSMTVTPDANPASATLSGALKFYYDDGDRNPIALTLAEGDAVYLFYNMMYPDLNPAYLYFNYLYQIGSKDQKVDSYWDYYYGASYHDYGQTKMKIKALDGDDSEGYTMTLVQYDDPDESNVRFENIGSLFRQELSFTDKNGDSVTPKLTRFVVTTAENKTIYMYNPLASTQEDRYIRGPVIMEPLKLSDDGNIYFALMFVDDIKNETLYFTAEDEDGNVYTVSKAAPTDGFENGKYYYGELELTWQKCISGTTATPVNGLYTLEEDPVNITISGYSEGYQFKLKNGQGGTITLDNLTATGDIFIYQVDTAPRGDVSLVLKGDNSIYADTYLGIELYGGLKLSCTGASATLTVTATIDGFCGIEGSNYKFDTNSNNRGITTELDVSAQLAAPGFTVTRSARTDNPGGTYTWTYTVVNHWVDLSQLTDKYVAQDGDWLTGELSGNYKISIADGATVTLAGITINGGFSWSTEWAGITCEGNATLVLADGTANSVKPFHSDYAAINLHSGKTLTIQGSGSLTADARENYGNGAGIGGDSSSIYGNIVITGAANVTAYGGNGGAGIGGGGDGGYIDIAGAANVTAYGGYGSAGIGNGSNSNSIDVNSGDITIRTSGTVKAYGGEGAAGIGSSLADEVCNTNCGNILISQGIIVATGGQNAAGIGTGYAIGSAHSTCRNITIEYTVTSVTVTKGAGASECIGRSGYHSDCDPVTIDGVENATTSSTFLHFNSTLENNTWTLTHK